MKTTLATISAIRSPLARKAHVERAYLDYTNNYLSLGAFAEAYECTKEEARELIAEGRHWNSLPKA